MIRLDNVIPGTFVCNTCDLRSWGREFDASLCRIFTMIIEVTNRKQQSRSIVLVVDKHQTTKCFYFHSGSLSYTQIYMTLLFWQLRENKNNRERLTSHMTELTFVQHKLKLQKWHRDSEINTERWLACSTEINTIMNSDIQVMCW